MDQENFLELELDIDVTSHNELETCIEFKDSPQDSTDSDEQRVEQYDNYFDDFYYYHSSFSIYMNKCLRTEMQDRFTIIPRFDREQKMSYLAVFDGHGSYKVADFLSNNLHNYIVNSQYFNTDIKKALMEAFQKIDVCVQQSNELRPQESGSVVLCGIIYEDQLYLANLGDSKAIIIKQDDKIIQLTDEQTPERADEQKRIENLGGWVIPVRNKQRLQGQIDISRAIGDTKYKPFIIPDPEVTKYTLGQDDKYLIIATDGLWNNATSENIVKYSKQSQSISDLPKVIFNESQNIQQIKDNTTILCLDIQQYLAKIIEVQKQLSSLT